jgi:hypothetical protein
MELKNVQKTRFYACLKTKSLYTVIEKMFKTHVETASLSLNKNNDLFQDFSILVHNKRFHLGEK